MTGLIAEVSRSTSLARKAVKHGRIQSLNGRLRDECLNAHQFLSIHGARRKIEAQGAIPTYTDQTARWVS